MVPPIRTVYKELTIDIWIGKGGIEVLRDSAATDEIFGRKIGKNENEQILRKVCEAHLDIKLSKRPAGL